MGEQSGRAVPHSVANKLDAAADVVANSGLVNMKIEDIAAAYAPPVMGNGII